MSRSVYRFSFNDQIPFESIEITFLRSVLAAEALHGDAQVRLDAAHYMDSEKRMCVIDAGTSVGQDLSRLLTGFAIREFGPDAFHVERLASLVEIASPSGAGG